MKPTELLFRFCLGLAIGSFVLMVLFSLAGATSIAIFMGGWMACGIGACIYHAFRVAEEEAWEEDE